MRIRSFLLSVVSAAALAGAAAHAQTLAEQIEEQSQGTIQGFGNFFRYRVDGLDPSLYDTPVVKVVQPRKFFVDEKPDLTVMVQGGSRPYAFSLIGPALPKGLSFDPRKGNFVGSTKVPGTASYVMAVQDARGRVAQSDPFTVTFLDDFDESQYHDYPVEAFVDGNKLVSPQPIFDGSATTDVAADGFGSTVAVRFDQPIRAKTAVVAFSTEAAFGACSYDLEAKDPEGAWKPVHRASSQASGGVVQAFNLMPTPRSGFVSDEWRVNLTSGCHMRLSELRIASAPPNPPPAWQTPEGLLVAVGPVPLGVSIVAPEQSPYSNVATRFELAGGSTLPAGFGLKENGDLTGPDGEGLPYGRIDFRVRSTDGIGYWTERNYFITPDALPARIVYPVSLKAGNAADPRHAMNDGLVDQTAEGVSVAAAGTMLFDYGRFVRVTGGTVLAGENVGSMLLEAEAGPDQWVDPVLVGNIAKRWRLVNQSAEAAFVREARLDEADFNHPPAWKTAEGPWVVDEGSLSFAGRRDSAGALVEAAVEIPALRLPIAAEEQSIYSEAPATLSLAQGTSIPTGLTFDGGGLTVAKGEDMPAGRLTVRLTATDALGYASQRSFVFNPATVRARTVMPTVAGPGGDVTMLLNDGQTDKATALAAGQSFEWDFGRYVAVFDGPQIVADKPEALVLEAFANGGWVQPNAVDGIAKRWRARATAAVSVSEFRLDGAGAILPPTWSPSAVLRIVGPNGFGTGVDRKLAVAATARNPYANASTTVSVVGRLPAGFTFDGGDITVPAGESFSAGRVEVVLKAEDARGISSQQAYPFAPLSVRASTLVPQVRDAVGGDVYFQLYDGVVGAEARSVHLEAGQSVVFGFQRYASIQAANVVDASDPSRLAFEAETADGWVAAEQVGSVAKRFRVRATGPVDLREFRLDGSPAPGAPIWSTPASPYVVSETGINGTARFTVALSARVDNQLAEPDPIYTVQGTLPEGFAYADRVITAPRGSRFASGRQVVTIRASDSTGFFTDRGFVFNPESVPAQPIKPDVRDRDGRDVFGIMSDGRTVTDPAQQAADMGVALADGQSVTFDYGRTVNAGRGAVTTNLGGSVVVEAETANGWVPAPEADWIATRFRVRAVGATFLSEVRLDGLPAQPGPLWTTYSYGRMTIADATSIGLVASARSIFSDKTTVTYSAPRGLAAGFSVANGSLFIPNSESFPAGMYNPVVRATDSVGVWADYVFPFDAAAPRAIGVRSSIVGPGGKDVYTTLTDGAVAGTDAGVAMAVGDTVVFDYGRYVLLQEATVFAGTGAYAFEAETVDGWVAAGIVGNRAKRYRFRATEAGIIREARLDGLEVQGPPTWNTLGDPRTVDQAGLSLTLSSTIRSRFGAPVVYSAPNGLPSGFGLTGEGVLTAPPGESFPTGAASILVRARDDVGFVSERSFPFAPATVRAKTVIPTNIADAGGANVVQVLNDDVKGASAPGVALTAGQTVVWTFPRYVKIVAAENVVDATAPAALVLETDGGSAGWVPASSLDTGKRFRIRATASVTVREYRLDGVGAFVLPTWATAAQPWEVSPTAVSGQTGLQLQVAASNNSPFPGAMTYSLVPGASLPSGFSLSATGLITVPSADVFPAGRVDVAVRATDPVGNKVDRTFAFHPLGVSAAVAAPKTVASDGGTDLRVAMLDGRTDASDASVVLSAGQSLVYDYGQQWVRIAAASVFDVTPAGAVLETKAADGSWVQMTAAPASAFPPAVQDQGGRLFRIRQVSGTSTLREARLGGQPVLGPVFATAGTVRSVDQSTIVGNSPAGLTLALSATKTAMTSTAVSYAWAPGFTAPAGFALSADGKLTVLPGESFPYGRVAAAVRATTDDYTADRTFPFNPAAVRLATVAPDSVLDKDGNSVVVALYDGATGTGAGVRSVSLNAGESVVWTFPRYVQNVAAAIADGVNLGNLVLEAERASGEWVAPSAVDSIGRRWRVRATAAATIREYRLDGAGTFLSPVWTTAGGSRTVSETTIANASPASLTLQLQATNKSLRPSDPLSYAVAPGSDLPQGFSLTSAGLLSVPKATEFTAGNLAFSIRVTDTLGFFADQSFVFNPEVVAMTAQMPSAVVAPDGADVFVPLYSGLADTQIDLPMGQSITWTFPRYVSPAAGSVYVVSANTSNIVLETPAQGGGWTVVHYVNAPAGTSSPVAYGKTYRLRNASVGPVTVSAARLGGVGPQAPTWNTVNAAPWRVSETQISNPNGGTVSGQAQQLAATKVFAGAASLSYALKPGSKDLPAGFSLSSSGVLTMPKGEGFPGGLAEIAVRAQDSRGFYADRTFQYVPEAIQANATAPTSVVDAGGADALVPLYDNNTDQSVSVSAGQSISWTFPRYVAVSAGAIAVSVANGSDNGFLALESLRADGTWAQIQSYSVTSNSNIGFATNSSAPYNVGRQWRLRFAAASGTVRLTEFRLDAAGHNQPTITTLPGPWEVNQTQVIGASPIALSLQLAGVTVYGGTSQPLTYSLKPGTPQLPAGFGLSTSGLLVVPQGESFPVGFVQGTVRATDARGFYVDKDIKLFPTSVQARNVAPTTVVDANGADVYSHLYDGADATSSPSVTLAPGASVTYTFPRYVNNSGSTVSLGSGGQSLVVERPDQSGGWTIVEQWLNGSFGGLPGDATNRISKVFRVRNASATNAVVREWRLDGSVARTPVWTTSAGPYTVSDTAVTGQSGLSLTVAATSASSSTALTYALVPGATLPAGYSVSSAGTIEVEPASTMPGGRIDVPVRVTDGHGLYADRTFTFLPAGAVGASSLPPVAVTGPTGENLLTVVYDGREDTGYALQPGQAVVFAWDRFVTISRAGYVFASQASCGGNPLSLQTLAADGQTWRTISTYAQSPACAVTAYAPASADSYGKTFRLLNIGAAAITLSETRLDSAPSYGVVVTTSGGVRTVAAGIAGTSPASLSLQLAARMDHPKSTLLKWAFGGVLPIDFTLTEGGLLTVPSGPNFPFGLVEVPVLATDDLGFAGTTTLSFSADSIRASTTLPRSVVGPNGEDLFRSMYDGRTETSASLAKDQSITYTFDRYVQTATIAQSRFGSTTNSLVVEVPNQAGGWSTATTIVNSGDGGTNGARSISKVFRLRNTAAAPVVVQDFPIDGAPYLTPFISTSNSTRLVTPNGIAGQPAGTFSLQLAASNNNPNGGAIVWSASAPLPAGFTLTPEGVLTAPLPTDFPGGYVVAKVRATDQGGFFAEAALPFKPEYVTAKSVAPVSVTGGAGQDLLRVLYDGQAATTFDIGGSSVTYTYDRWVQLNEVGISLPGYSISGNTNLMIEARQADGTWATIGVLFRQGGSTSSGLSDTDRNVAKVFRVRDVLGTSTSVAELRLDNASSYGLQLSTAESLRSVGDESLGGTSPPSLSLQLQAWSLYPTPRTYTWTARGTLPAGFTLTSDGLLSVPRRQDLPAGYVSVPVRVTDQLGFTADGNYPFAAAWHNAKNVVPTSVRGPAGEDVFATLYDGDAASSFALAPGASITYTYPRHVRVADMPAPPYVGTWPAGTTLVLQVPAVDGSWNTVWTFTGAQNSWQSIAPSPNAALYNQSTVFRVVNTGSTAATLNEFRLDNPTHYGISWGQFPTVAYVGPSSITEFNGGGALVQNTSGRTLALNAVSGYPGGAAVTFAWTPGFTPPDGFVLAGGKLQVPAGADFPAGRVDLKVRAADDKGFVVSDRTLTFAPWSVRASTVAPASVVDRVGTDVRVGLYDDDASTSSTVATTLPPGDSLVWTYPAWTNMQANATAVSDFVSPLTLERQSADGTWQAVETRAVGGGATAGSRGDAYPSKVWRLRNSGSATASITEWRLDGAPSYAPTLQTTTTLRYVTQTSIVDALGGTTASAGTSGLTLSLAGTVVSPGGGSLSYAWASSFVPPAGFDLAPTGQLTVPAQDDMPNGPVMLSVKFSDPRGFAATRVLNFVADSVRARDTMVPGSTKVMGADGADIFNGLVDGATAAAATLQPGQAVTWTFPRHVNLQTASTSTMSTTSWALEIPTQTGTWTAAETSAGLVGSTPAVRTSRTFRLRNTGTAALAIGEFAIDGAPRGGAPTAGSWPLDAGRSILVPNYTGTAYSVALAAAPSDPYYNRVTYAAAGTLPAGITVSSEGVLAVPAGLTVPSQGWALDVALVNGLGRSATATYLLFDNSKVRILQNGSSRNWADGTYATTCAGYAKAAGRYVYEGAIGDGTYTIDPDGAGPIAPQPVACGSMASASPTTTVPALATGLHGFPGNNNVSRVDWVLSNWTDFYQAVAALTTYHTIDAVSSTETYDITRLFSKQGSVIASCSGTCSGWTFYHAGNSGGVFWFDTYGTDPSGNGGPGLNIRSPNVVFR